MGDATLHRHGDTIPGPDGPPIVPFPRKRAALSAPGGALVLSPLEIPPKERRGSDSGKRSRGRPICNTCVRRTFWCGGRTDLRFEYSAAGRRLLIFVGSPYRPLLRMGELTQMCQLIPDIFSFPPCTAQKVNCPEGARDAPLEGFLFDVSKRKWGVRPCGGSPRPFAEQRECKKHSNGQSPFGSSIPHGTTMLPRAA